MRLQETLRGRLALGMLLLAALACAAEPPAKPAAPPEEVHVMLLTIVATDRNRDVDKRIKCIADELRKSHPELTGFKLRKECCKKLTVGKKYTFPLLDDQTLTVTVLHGATEDNWVGLVVKPPQMGEVTYETACGKFFPYLVRAKDRSRDRLVIALAVRTCNAGKDKKPCKDEKK